MAKRHAIHLNDWESVFLRLEELVLANSGQDAFEEIFKLLIAKLWDERNGGSEFKVHATAAETAKCLNRLLARANSQWSGILGDLPASLLLDEHLEICVKVLSELSLSDSSYEVMDGVFEFLVSQASKGAKGQYFTPRHIVDFCVSLINPKVTELVCDPACGSAGFLVHVFNHVARRGDAPKDYPSSKLWGFEFDARAVRVAKALMLLAGDGSSNIYRINSLLTPNNTAMLFDREGASESAPFLTIEDVLRSHSKNFSGFDVIVTNPPFAGEIKEERILKTYTLYRADRRMERDVLFIERCVQLLKPGGRIAIVLPHNKVGSLAWSYVREWLLRQLRVVAVIGLGRNSFLPHTHQKTAILVGVKRRRPMIELPKERVFFSVSEHDAKDSRGQYVLDAAADPDRALWRQSRHDLGEIGRDFREFCGSESIGWGL